MRASKRFIVILVLLLGSLVLTACLGPKPVVRDYAVQAPAQGTDEPYNVDVTVANEGPGGGQIELEVDLVNKQSGVTIAQQTQEIDLQKDKVVQVVVTLDVPEWRATLLPTISMCR